MKIKSVEVHWVRIPIPPERQQTSDFCSRLAPCVGSRSTQTSPATKPRGHDLCRVQCSHPHAPRRSAKHDDAYNPVPRVAMLSLDLVIISQTTVL